MRRPPHRKPIGLALAGGGPFGSIYEIEAVMARWIAVATPGR